MFCVPAAVSHTTLLFAGSNPGSGVSPTAAAVFRGDLGICCHESTRQTSPTEVAAMSETRWCDAASTHHRNHRPIHQIPSCMDVEFRNVVHRLHLMHTVRPPEPVRSELIGECCHSHAGTPTMELAAKSSVEVLANIMIWQNVSGDHGIKITQELEILCA